MKHLVAALVAAVLTTLVVAGIGTAPPPAVARRAEPAPAPAQAQAADIPAIIVTAHRGVRP